MDVLRNSDPIWEGTKSAEATWSFLGSGAIIVCCYGCSIQPRRFSLLCLNENDLCLLLFPFFYFFIGFLNSRKQRGRRFVRKYQTYRLYLFFFIDNNFCWYTCC
jgi:hypothetical protein